MRVDRNCIQMITICFTVLFAHDVSSGNNRVNLGAVTLQTNASSNTRCRHSLDIQAALPMLSSDQEEVSSKARWDLFDYSRKSTSCRKEVIRVVTHAMDKPNLDFSKQRSDYYLWLEGAELLGQLKAVESLDLLISHLDLTEGPFVSASMNHQPAISGVTEMGSLAIPKLRDALLHNPNCEIRAAVVLCLTSIGGNQPTTIMRQALLTESNIGVSRFLRLSLNLLARQLKYRRTAKSSDLEALKKARLEHLTSFGCKE